jgi:para-aminobenzoate synthetase/4-amino-4-deoxychorismate lyase
VYTNPVEIIEVYSVEEVVDALRKVESAIEAGLHAAGFVAYEAGPAFDPALAAHAPFGEPLLWFGIYTGFSTEESPTPTADALGTQHWEPTEDRPTYVAAVERIRAYIAAGDTYQVNYTYPLEAEACPEPVEWFNRLCTAQRAEYCAYVDTGRLKVLSASPELFFRLDNGVLKMRPMKGTRPRGLWYEDDLRAADDLARSDKDRAENIMIVDLIRNDMGRISETGSVRVDRQFDIERYETVWQMTSTITSRTRATVPEIFGALFPSGSVTGAPKIRTTQIIRELEPQPRGVYCGAIGWWAPKGQAQFNVAIRTVTMDADTRRARYGIGSGITWDSEANNEFRECSLKAAILTRPEADFELLESMLWDGDFLMLDEHLTRLNCSAEYFGFDVDIEAVERALLARAESFRPEALKVRLLVSRKGSIRVDTAPLEPDRRMRVGLAKAPVNRRNVYLYHKTTNRSCYETMRAARSDCDEVLLWNDRGEITESTIANVVLDLDGDLVTPPIVCGLLPGIMRNRMLEEGAIREAIVSKDDLNRARSVRLINSVRRWINVDLIDDVGHGESGTAE